MPTQLKHDDYKEEILTILHQLSTWSTFGSAGKSRKQSFQFFDFTRPLRDFELLNVSKPISVDGGGRGGSSNRKLRQKREATASLYNDDGCTVNGFIVVRENDAVILALEAHLYLLAHIRSLKVQPQQKPFSFSRCRGGTMGWPLHGGGII